MKRLTAFLLCLCLALTVVPSALAANPLVADDNQPVNDAELALLQKHEEDSRNDVVWTPVGEEYHLPQLEDFDASSPAIYTCRVKENRSLYAVRYPTSSAANTAKRVLRARDRAYMAELLAYDQTWAIVREGQAIGYIKRQSISEVEPLDPVHTQPYGVQKSTYIATTATQTYVRKSMSAEDDSWVILNPGTMLSIWKIQEGWAVVPYHRTFGYIDMRELTNLIPVSPTDDSIRDDSPIAAYTSYYGMGQNWENVNRICNIRVACQRLNRVMQPGDQLDFNDDVGPYREALGYRQAPVLINGISTPGFGGGTCQVSSTLYNALLQVPGLTIVHRHAHGPSGASYLPHGVDAAVGNDAKKLNLIFRNDYDFPVRVEGHTSDDGALLMLVYRADAE